MNVSISKMNFMAISQIYLMKLSIY